MSINNPSRRRFIGTTALFAVSVPFVAKGLVGEAAAADLKPLPLDNPQAKALKYAEDYTKVTDPAHKPADAHCANCLLFVAATNGCGLFAGYSVAPLGWCSAWAKKPA
ncbi:MAG: high-potential iron-sulfur protein [Dokdonella sp.]